jgi:hypothetical protein
LPDQPLSHSIRQFIALHLRSVEQLEILLLVSRKPEVVWTVKAVYDSILSSVPSVQRWMDEFVRTGFLEANGASPTGYRYIAKTEIAQTVADLAQCYQTMPVRVIEAIYKKDTDPAQSFADAFKLKPDEPDT